MAGFLDSFKDFIIIFFPALIFSTFLYDWLLICWLVCGCFLDGYLRCTGCLDGV